MEYVFETSIEGSLMAIENSDDSYHWSVDHFKQSHNLAEKFY